MAVPGHFVLENSTTKDHQDNGLSDIDALLKQKESLNTENDQFHSSTIYKENGPVTVHFETCECSSAVQQRNDKNVDLKNLVVNRGITHVMFDLLCHYFIGMAFGWILLGMFQYLVCVVILGDSLLDPWYFTCAWIVEIICMLNIMMIIWVIECSHKRVELLEYYEKITWIGFTFLIFQVLAILLLLLPISCLFKFVLGDFSQSTTFFIYWMIVAFPHIMILCFAIFGDCSSKIFRSFSRHLRHAESWNNHEQDNVRSLHFNMTNQQDVLTATLNNDNNIELQELNYFPINCSNK